MILMTADIHLHPDAPERTERFIRFVTHRATSGDLQALYILGDLFDFWIGPAHPRTGGVRRVLEALSEAAATGAGVHFIPGNRDFHLDRKVLGPYGIDRLGETHSLETGAGRLFLTHGDQFCTRDIAYRTTRAVIRSRPARLAWRALPPKVAAGLAGGFRSMSRRSVKRKPRAVKGIPDHALYEAFRAGADVIICGHVHTQGHHRFDVDGRVGELYTLASWEEGSPHLVVDGSRILFGGERPCGT